MPSDRPADDGDTSDHVIRCDTDRKLVTDWWLMMPVVQSHKIDCLSEGCRTQAKHRTLRWI
nr:hypothetical protein [Nocardia asiatica]